MISKHNLGWLFSNFPCLRFLIAFPSLLLWIRPKERTCQMPACIAFAFIPMSHRGHSSTAGWGPFISSLTASQKWLQARYFQTSPGRVCWMDREMLNWKPGREGNPWNGILKGKNKVSARRTRRGKVGLTEVLCKVSPGEFHMVGSGRA